VNVEGHGRDYSKCAHCKFIFLLGFVKILCDFCCIFNIPDGAKNDIKRVSGFE
jgi:hypothetical protein